jgi:hypothetical protein
MSNAISNTRHDNDYATQTTNLKSRPREIGRRAKLRNKCNITTKLHPKAANSHAINPIHTNIKIDILLNPASQISTSEARKRCNKAIGTIVRKASNTLINRHTKRKRKYKL